MSDSQRTLTLMAFLGGCYEIPTAKENHIPKNFDGSESDAISIPSRARRAAPKLTLLMEPFNGGAATRSDGEAFFLGEERDTRPELVDSAEGLTAALAIAGAAAGDAVALL